MKTNPEATVLSTSQPARCPICDWPMADDQSNGCIPGDCSYRPDDPAEQERIRKRRAAIAVMPDRYTVDDPWSRPAMPAGTQGALALYLNEVKPVDGRVQLINISVDELSVLRRLAAAERESLSEAELVKAEIARANEQDADISASEVEFMTTLAAQPAQAAVGGDALLLMQARYVLLNLNAERPGCGYDKLADACEAAGLSEALVQPAEKET